MPEKLGNYTVPNNLLDNRIILITGAGDGIGRALAKACGSHGATTVLLGKTISKLESVYDEIEANGGPQPGIYPMDLLGANWDDHCDLAATLGKEYGRLDGLVHNAGILGDLSPINHQDTVTWQKVLHVNLNAPFMLTKACFDLLNKSEDASVIFTSSGVGRKGRAYWGAYAVSKFGTEGLMQVFADETETGGRIRANCVNPGKTRTAMRRQAYPGEDPFTLKKPEEILDTYLYLLGPDSKGISGKSFDAQ